MGATVAASIYHRGIEATRIIASGSHKQEAVDSDFESCLTIETRTLIISQLSNIGASTTDIAYLLRGQCSPLRLSPALRCLVLHDDVTTAVVKCEPFNCQTWTGIASKQIPKMLKPLVNLTTLYIYTCIVNLMKNLYKHTTWQRYDKK